MQKIFLISFIIVVSGFVHAADMNIEISEKINISSDNIEIKEGKIEFQNNVNFQSKSYEISGEVAEYIRSIEVIKIKGSPVKFKIATKDKIFKGSSNLIFIKENEIEISGSVLIEDDSSRIRGELIKFNILSGELLIK